MHTLCLFKSVDGSDIGVIQRGQDFRFSLQPAYGLAIRSKLLGKYFQRDISIQLGIGSTVDLTHTAFTDFLQDFVMADSCPDHGSSQMLPFL